MTNRASLSNPVVLHHDLNPDSFMWLWGKYAVRPNLKSHCQACLVASTVHANSGRGSPYSQRFSKASNPTLRESKTLVLDECAPGSYSAIYLCGVHAEGYAAKKNYPRNLHAAIIPCAGAADRWEFDGWHLRLENGLFTRIPPISELPEEYRHLPEKYTTCRIFRWAACILPRVISDGLAATDILLHPDALPSSAKLAATSLDR